MPKLPADDRLGILPAIPAAEVASGRLDKLHIGHAVFACDLQSPHQLLAVEGIERAGANGRIMSKNDALRVLNHPNADHEPRSDRIGGTPGRQRRDLKERGIAIKDVRDTLANRHLAARSQKSSRFRTTALSGLLEKSVHDGDHLEHVSTVLPIALVPDIEPGLKDRHDPLASRPQNDAATDFAKGSISCR